MAHRSNQAVASQERTPAAPAEPPPPRRYLIGWATAFAALTVSTTLVAAGVWLARIPLAKFMIGAALSERGAEAAWRFSAGICTGWCSPTSAPIQAGAAISAVEALALARVRAAARSGAAHGTAAAAAAGPRRMGVGRSARQQRRPAQRAPAHRTADRTGGRRRRRPDRGAVRPPEGAFSAGRIGEDFSAVGRIAETSRPGQVYALERGGAEPSSSRARTRSRSAWRRKRAALPERRARGRRSWWRRARAARSGADRCGSGVAPGQPRRRKRHRLASGDLPGRRADSRTPGSPGPRRRERAAAFRSTTSPCRMRAPKRMRKGLARRARTLERLAGFAGLGMISQQPAASGRFFIDDARRVSGDALLTLTRTSPDADAQQTLRSALPISTARRRPHIRAGEERARPRRRQLQLSAPLLIGADSQDAPHRHAGAGSARRVRRGCVFRRCGATRLHWSCTARPAPHGRCRA